MAAILEAGGLRAYLLTQAGVTALVGAGTDLARIYPVKLPQNPKFPAISYQRVSGQRVYSMTAPSGLAFIGVQVDCWAEVYQSVKDTADAVRQAVEGHVGAMGSESVKAAFLDNERDFWSDPLGIYRVTQDYMIHYAEANP